jgi:hypothetical protein
MPDLSSTQFDAISNEEARFYEYLADYKVKKGEDIVDVDIYNFWINKWASRAKNIVKF